MNNQVVIEEVAGCLTQGGIALVPTDTVYGLAVSPHFPKAVERLYAMKARPQGLKLPLMVAASDQLADIGVIVNKSARDLFESPFMPGALTLALGVDASKAPDWLAGREEIAIRIPNHKEMLAILGLTGALFVTSANVHKENTPQSVAEILSQLGHRPDIILEGITGGGVASSLVNCNCNPPRIERLGAIPESELMEYLK